MYGLHAAAAELGFTHAAHMDLKPNNLLVFAESVKVCDLGRFAVRGDRWLWLRGVSGVWCGSGVWGVWFEFGFLVCLCQMSKEGRLRLRLGTHGYMPEEQRREMWVPKAQLVDVYALGVIGRILARGSFDDMDKPLDDGAPSGASSASGYDRKVWTDALVHVVNSCTFAAEYRVASVEVLHNLVRALVRPSV